MPQGIADYYAPPFQHTLWQFGDPEPGAARLNATTLSFSPAAAPESKTGQNISKHGKDRTML
jgi:hypothetical protein